MRVVLNESTCPVFRDPFDDFKPLERLFGSMTVGMAFGESGFINIADNIPRFYNAVALSECICLTISKNEYLCYLEKQEKKSENQKLIYIKQIPELNNMGIARSKLRKFCQSLQPYFVTKGSVLFKEGDPANFVYFVR